MIKSFFKIALRFLWRNKTYTLLNYLCLTFGLSCSIVAMLHINKVLSSDRFHENYDRLYAVEANVTFFNGDRFPKQVLSASLTDKLNEGIPEIDLLSRISGNNYILQNGDKVFTENGIYADDTFFDMFTFPLLSGTFSDSLWGINSIVLSEGLAVKLFGSTDCLGKTLILKNNNREEGFNIAGVLKNVPSVSYIKFEFVIPFSKFLAENSGALDAGASATEIWALLHDKSDAATINEKIRDLIKNQEATLNQELFLFPLKEKVLFGYAGGKRVWREMQYVFIAGILGLSILLIACFNYINLAIALNIRRYREAGIRKVVGAKKSTIVFQYLGETFILTLLSFFTALDLVRLLVHSYNSLLNQQLNFSFSDFRVIIGFALIAIFTGLFSGLFPAFYLSSSNPVSTLKGKIVTGHSFSLFRQSLIVFQFTIPAIFIIFMLIIKTQDKFLRSFDLGFEKEKLLIISNSEPLHNHEESFKADLLSIPDIKSVSFSNCIPTRGASLSSEVLWDGKDATKKLSFWCINTDFNYNSIVNLEITRGRYFDKSFPSDSACFVINDVAAEVMKYDDPVGRSLTLDGRKGTIIGVFKNYHTIDLSGPFTPTIISVNHGIHNNLLVSFSSSTYSSIVERVGNVYKKYESEAIYQPYLFSDFLSRSELATPARLVGVAFVIALLLACLGLSGLASYTAQIRTREIGIRKINGATTFSIMKLLGMNYTKWLLISSIISLPIAFLLGNIFLHRFRFHASMPVWAFITGPIIAYLIAVITVSWQSWRAASRNPVEALRYE